MESSGRDQRKKKIHEVQTFPVPFDLGVIKENTTINTNKQSKEKIINQAFKFHSQGNILEAAKYYQLFINQGFKDYRVFSNYGAILKDLKKLKEAELFTCKAIKINPNHENSHLNLGSILKDLGKPKEAELSTRKAIEINPNFTEAHLNLGTILRDLGKLKDAELSTRKAIKLNPDNAIGYSNLANILRSLGDLEKAEIHARKAIELKADFAEAYSNLGNILKELGKLHEAELYYRKAIKLHPSSSEAYFNLSLLELLKGDYKNGFRNYEFRFKKKNPIFIHGDTKLKRIECENLKKGEKLLVISEQGLGDTLLYMRYVLHLKKKGIDVSFSCQKKLHSLIKSSGIDSNPLTPEQTNQITKGKWIPLMSLPNYLKITPENPIISEPYIHSTEELNQKWKNILFREKRPIIGINWQGNQKTERDIYPERSLPLEVFSILANQNEVTLLSLQKGFGSEQLEKCSFKNKFVECQAQIDVTWDFLENAAIIENCDLIITCDTSIAHLAGGMGKDVWLLLKNIPFWTWGLEKTKTFWYPSMKLFRQKERQNWQEVMERVSSKIKKEIEVKI